MSEQLLEYAHFFEVKLPFFSGPIDLLLHLIKLNELPIEKVSLAEVTGQYLSCLDAIKDFDLEVAGEYLVIAATLISIKSSVLLNEPVQLVADEHGNLIDPHVELLLRLREAEVYKEGANILSSRALLDHDVFTCGVNGYHKDPGAIRYKDHDSILLGRAFHKLIAKLGADAALMTINIESVSISERMSAVILKLKQGGGSLDFDQLLPLLSSKAAIIGTFVALLELCKRQIIFLQQQSDNGVADYGVIHIRLAQMDIDVATFESEFDVAILPESVLVQSQIPESKQETELIANG